jgi:hypothetical protein
MCVAVILRPGGSLFLVIASADPWKQNNKFVEFKWKAILYEPRPFLFFSWTNIDCVNANYVRKKFGVNN